MKTKFQILISLGFFLTTACESINHSGTVKHHQINQVKLTFCFNDLSIINPRPQVIHLLYISALSMFFWTNCVNVLMISSGMRSCSSPLTWFWGERHVHLQVLPLGVSGRLPGGPAAVWPLLLIHHLTVCVCVCVCVFFYVCMTVHSRSITAITGTKTLCVVITLVGLNVHCNTWRHFCWAGWVAKYATYPP